MKPDRFCQTFLKEESLAHYTAEDRLDSFERWRRWLLIRPSGTYAIVVSDPVPKRPLSDLYDLSAKKWAELLVTAKKAETINPS